MASPLDSIAGPVSNSFLLGNFGQLFSINGWEFHHSIAERFGKIVKIYGPLNERQLYVFDHTALRHILVTDQNIWQESPVFIDTNRILFGDGILASLGDIHRKQRKLLNPVFSPSHLKAMLPIIYEVVDKLRAVLELGVTDGSHEIDVLRWITRGSLEMIGQGGLGYSFDPLVEGSEPHPYSKSILELVPTLSTLAFQRAFLLPTLVRIGSRPFQRFMVNLMPWKNVARVRDIINLMDKTSTEIFHAKKRALAEGDDAVSRQVGQGKDIMSILMRANLAAAEGERMSDKEVLGQMSAFIFAATDTTSNATARILHLLATHPEVQEKLRKEVLGARAEHGDLMYSELVALPFLDAVVRETLRLYPPVAMVTRTACQDVVLPLSTPIRGADGCEISALSVPIGTEVIVSIMMANHDATLWGSDALEWKPARWLAPLPQTVIDAHIPGVFSHTMTFIGGGRACVGFKFSEMEMKAVVSALISKFRFSLTKKEIVWELGFLMTPSVKGQPGHQLPLVVELVGPVSE